MKSITSTHEDPTWHTSPYPSPTRLYNIITLTYQIIHLNTLGLTFTLGLVILESNLIILLQVPESNSSSLPQHMRPNFDTQGWIGERLMML